MHVTCARLAFPPLIVSGDISLVGPETLRTESPETDDLLARLLPEAYALYSALVPYTRPSVAHQSVVFYNYRQYHVFRQNFLWGHV